MLAGKHREQDLIEKIRRLPEDKLTEVEDFVRFPAPAPAGAPARAGGDLRFVVTTVTTYLAIALHVFLTMRTNPIHPSLVRAPLPA